MAFYHHLKTYQRAEDAARAAGHDVEYPDKAAWIGARLLALRTHLRDQITGRRRANSLIIGSWNIRAFDDGRSRMDESFHYIAEIIDSFDICAVQEVKQDLKPLERLVKLLGPNWDYFVNDVTEGSPGNNERMAFLYNRNRVRFKNLIGELVLPQEALIEGRQIARSPFFASFQAGWFRFTLCSAHILYGGGTVADHALRAAEIRAISKVLARRSEQTDEVHVLLGDMNIEAAGDPIMQAMTDEGLHVPLFGATNLGGTKHYDQIAFTKEDVKTRLLGKGSFDWRGAVFGPWPDPDHPPKPIAGHDRLSDQAFLDHYEPVNLKQRAEADKEPYKNWAKSYGGWTTYEMSDHLPIWIEIEIDYSDDYLRRFL